MTFLLFSTAKKVYKRTILYHNENHLNKIFPSFHCYEFASFQRGMIVQHLPLIFVGQYTLRILHHPPGGSMSVVFVVAEEKRNTHSHGSFLCGVLSLNIKTYFLWGVEDQKGRDPFWRSMHKLHLVRCVSLYALWSSGGWINILVGKTCHVLLWLCDRFSARERSWHKFHLSSSSKNLFWRIRWKPTSGHVIWEF